MQLSKSLTESDIITSFHTCWNLTELKRRFSNPDPLPEAIILEANSNEELEAFRWFLPRLNTVFFILILPDAEEETVAKGHLLRPRFLTYSDGDLKDIKAVLQQITEKKNRQSDVVSVIDQTSLQVEECNLWKMKN